MGEKGFTTMELVLLEKNKLTRENERLKQKLSKQETQLDFLKDENRHMRNVLAENRELKQRNKQLSLVGEKQAKFIQSKGFDVKELIDFARDGDND